MYYKEMTTDVPDLTTHEMRALIYIQQVNRELEQEKPANISTHSRESEWSSKYFTRAWKNLEPQGLLKRDVDGQSSRLSLTDKGHKIADMLKQMNEVLEE